MAATIANLGTLQSFGVWADRNARSPKLAFRRYNLIYGFNGSGKSTLSRLFASLSIGSSHFRLPEDCAFDVTMTDGSTFGCPERPSGLERNILVFNSDYVEENLQWAMGLANPVFYIGADQAVAAAELRSLETQITTQAAGLVSARATWQAAEKGFSNFKRDRARITASNLYLGNRKYEAPALAKDFDTFASGGVSLLSQPDLDAAKEVRQRAEPPPKLDLLAFDAERMQKPSRLYQKLVVSR